MFAFMADIHIGAKYTNESLFKTLDNFLKIIKDHEEECKCIFVAGDLFEHKLTVDEAKTAANFLVRLVCNGCRKDGLHVPVHFIHGTYSHDREQYEMFLPLIMKLPNADVFYTDKACAVNFRGTKILYLPQESGNDISYDEFFKNKYDIIVGHGPVSGVNKSPCPTADYDILHSAELLGDISKICVFGHYHGFTDFGNNVYYAGPWLRWKYGEEEPRRFFLCNDNFEVETFPNPEAVEFKTINIATAEELRGYISQNITTPHRFCITVSDNNLEEFHTIMSINKNNPNISYKMTSVKREETSEDDKVVAEYTKSDNVEPVPALISYIQDVYKVDVSEEIHDYENRIKESEK